MSDEKFSELKQRLIAATGSPGLTSYHSGGVHLHLREWERLIVLIESAQKPSTDGTTPPVVDETPVKESKPLRRLPARRIGDNCSHLHDGTLDCPRCDWTPTRPFARGLRVRFAGSFDKGVVRKCRNNETLVRWDSPMADSEWIENEKLQRTSK